jgi:hypothetical protein
VWCLIADVSEHCVCSIFIGLRSITNITHWKHGRLLWRKLKTSVLPALLIVDFLLIQAKKCSYWMHIQGDYEYVSFLRNVFWENYDVCRREEVAWGVLVSVIGFQADPHLSPHTHTHTNTNTHTHKHTHTHTLKWISLMCMCVWFGSQMNKNHDKVFSILAQFNLLKTNIFSYIKTQSVPRSKNTPSRL